MLFIVMVSPTSVYDWLVTVALLVQSVSLSFYAAFTPVLKLFLCYSLLGFHYGTIFGSQVRESVVWTFWHLDAQEPVAPVT